MTAADIAPWASPAIILVLFTWLRMDLGRRIDRLDQRMDRIESRLDRLEARMDALDDRLRAVEIAIGAMAAKIDLLERYFLRRNDPDGQPSPTAAE
ncbi:MAG: hypothetical protein OXG99_13955 [Alphaproteobacteria bacterium]|nr:hypothetical protein [Alphaproteobacteria bacterium]